MTSQTIPAVERIEAIIRKAESYHFGIFDGEMLEVSYGDLRELLTLSSKQSEKCASCDKPRPVFCETCQRDWES